MGRLINTDDLKIEITNYLTQCIDKGQFNVDITEVQIRIFNIINKQPTAFDVDAMVKQLENSNGMCGRRCCEDIIDIVRKGGKKV